VIFAGDSTRHDARLVDSDCQTDIAVLKVDGVSNLPTLSFADTGSLRVGQSVIAVGSPLGGRAIGSGIVSALHESITVADPVAPNTQQSIADTIQTSALQEGDISGGPLLNVGGQVVGVSVATQAGGVAVGFAISTDDIRSEVEQIVRDGSLLLPSLGVEGHDLSAQDSALHNLPAGAQMTIVDGGGPADAAGVRAGDIITAIDEVKLDSAHPLESVLVNQFRQGQRVTLTVVRQGTPTQFQATLGAEHPACG
jgi:putative serine protease PepD